MSYETKDRKILCSQAVNLATTVVLKQYPDGTTINDKAKFKARVKELCDDVFIPILTEYHNSVDESVLKAKLQADNVYGGKTLPKSAATGAPSNTRPVNKNIVLEEI